MYQEQFKKEFSEEILPSMSLTLFLCEFLRSCCRAVLDIRSTDVGVMVLRRILREISKLEAL